MNILFVVVLAVFWALGGILKVRKQGDQNRQKAPLARPRQHLLKRSDHYAAPAGRRPTRPSAGQTRAKLAEWRAAARKFASEAEEAFRVQMAEPSPQPQQALPKPRTGPVAAYVSESPQFAAKLPAAPEDQPAPGPIEMPPEEYLADLISDYADSDQLRRAILHYEILGRPLSLREPDESAVGL